MSKIIDFYGSGQPNVDGNVLEEMVCDWSNYALEASHTSIQWLFPLKEPSNFNPEAPLLTEEDIQKWNERDDYGALLRNNLAKSYRRFLKFLGLKVGIDKGITVKVADDFNDRIKSIWGNFNHNWLRITRCLASLRLLGLQAEADAFYKCLQTIYESKRFPIRENTFNFWTEAVNGIPFSKCLGS